MSGLRIAELDDPTGAEDCPMAGLAPLELDWGLIPAAACGVMTDPDRDADSFPAAKLGGGMQLIFSGNGCDGDAAPFAILDLVKLVDAAALLARRVCLALAMCAVNEFRELHVTLQISQEKLPDEEAAAMADATTAGEWTVF